MRLRAHRRGLVVWSSAVPADSHRTLEPTRRARIARRRYLRVSGWLAVTGLRRVARGVRLRGRPLISGVAFTTITFGLHLGVWGVVAVAGLWVLLYAVFTPARPEPARPGPARPGPARPGPARPGPACPQDAKLRQELAGYSTPAQRHDLEAALDRYPDQVTHNLRDILSFTARSASVPGVRT